MGIFLDDLVWVYERKQITSEEATPKLIKVLEDFWNNAKWYPSHLMSVLE